MPSRRAKAGRSTGEWRETPFDLPDHTVKQCHRFLRELLYVVEEQYRQQLARAYGWVPCPQENEEGAPDEDDEDDF